MYIQGFGGSWLSHPFWRARFLLTTAEQVDKVRLSGVPYVVIDDELGEAPTGTGSIPAQEIPPSEPAASHRSALPFVEVTKDTTQAKRDIEREQAIALVTRSKKVMKRVFESARLGRAVRVSEVSPIVEEVTESVTRNAHALLSVIRLKNRDEYTYFHSVAVCTLMVNIARHLNMDDGQVRDMGMAGLLHDIGKMGVPDEILNKPGRLTDEEFELVRGHPGFGHQMLLEATGIVDVALDVCLHHHEKMDGTGYPFALPGAQISRAARLGAICDVYDALTSDRVYKEGWNPLEAITAMWSWDGHFDRELLFAFMQSIGVFPVGMLVRLRSNRLGVVMENRRRSSRPRAAAFYATREQSFLPTEIVVIKDDFSGDQIVSAEDPDAWGFQDWDTIRDALMHGRDPASIKQG